MVEQSQNRLLDVTLVRCFAVFSLVVWHTYCIYMCWGDVINSPLDSAYEKYLSLLIPEANMPLFTFLAGYLFYYQLQRGKYEEYKSFFKSKIHRLLIPYLILGSAIVYLKYDYGKTMMDVLYGVPNHMWYCLMLFYCYAIYWLVEKKLGSFANACLAVFSLVVYSRYNSMWELYEAHQWLSGIEIAAYFYIFFYLGGVCYKYKVILFRGWKSTVIFLLLYLFVKIPFIRAISYMLIIFEVACLLSVYVAKSNALTKITQKIDTCSMGIYVIHSIILWNISHWPPILKYTAPMLEGHYIIAPIVVVILVFIISWGLTDLLLKTRVGKYLLG